MKSTTRAVALALLLLAALPRPSTADNWPQWRGPHGNGSSDDTGLPATLGQENILWRTPLPGPSAATPAVWGNRIFLTSTTASKDLLALCVNAADGALLWQKKFGRDRPTPINEMATPSPVTDGHTVWFSFGTGLVAACDFEGKELWRRDLEKDFGPLAMKHGFSSSPLLYRGRLYIQVLRRPKPYGDDEPAPAPLDSFLLAVDAQTGKDVFRCVRPAEDADDEAYESYSTPAVREGKDRAEILLFGGNCLSGHDPETGKEFWRYPYNPHKHSLWRTVPVPVADEDRIYGYMPRQGGPALALKAGGSGTLGADAVAWKTDETAPDVCSWLLYRGALYMLDGDRRVLSRLDPATGKAVWRGSVTVPGETGQGIPFNTKTVPGGEPVYRASPTAADGRIYCIEEKGNVLTAAAGDEFKILGWFHLGEGPCRSSLAIAGGRLYVRTSKALYGLGEKAGHAP